MIDKTHAEQEQEKLDSSPLGNHTAYVNRYDASLLFPIERDVNWQKRSIEQT